MPNVPPSSPVSRDARGGGWRQAAFGAALAGLVATMSAPSPAAELPQRIFISGHSLTDRPLPDMLEAMAQSAGHPITWQRQHIGGSTIRQRSSGAPGTPPGSGFTAGVDRDGQPIDVLAALAARTDDGRPAFDTLIITERHRVLDVLAHEDTVGQLIRFQDRFISANPDGVTFFYAPWADIDDKRAPARWVAYERAALPIWRCAVEQANAQRAAAGRRDHIGFVPASLALADLVAELAKGADVPGFRDLSPQARIEALFSDKVHLTPLGTYFVTLVTYGVALGGDVATAWQPPDLDPARTAMLRAFAARFLAEWTAHDVPPKPETCLNVPLAFIRTYTDYTQRAYRPEETGLHAFASRLRESLHYYLRLR